MSKRLHTASKIFFDSPYMIMIRHDDYNHATMQSESYKKILKHARLCIHGTWGYTQLKVEPRSINDQSTVVSSMSANNGFVAIRSYWCFEDEIDALQFRLSVGESSMHVFMWPKNLFTIYEVDESQSIY